MRVSWTAGGSSQSILKVINLEYASEGLVLKVQYFGHLMRRADSLEKTPILQRLGQKEKGATEDESWMASLTLWR